MRKRKCYTATAIRQGKSLASEDKSLKPGAEEQKK